MKTSTIASVGEKCGLGKPPAEYIQNSNESTNSMLKKLKGTGKLTVKDTVQIIKSEVEIQEYFSGVSVEYFNTGVFQFGVSVEVY